MTKTKKNPTKTIEKKPVQSLGDMNSQAREEFLRLVTDDTTLNQTWKGSLIPLISEKIPDDLTPLQDLIDGVPHAQAETTQN